MRLRVRSLALLRSGVAMSCGVGCRRGLDPELLWLWHRLASTAPIRPLAWEPPYAAGAALEKVKKTKKKKKKESSQWHQMGCVCCVCHCHVLRVKGTEGRREGKREGGRRKEGREEFIIFENFLDKAVKIMGL